MDDFNKLLNEELENPEFKQEWEKLELITPPNNIIIMARFGSYCNLTNHLCYNKKQILIQCKKGYHYDRFTRI